MERRVLVDQVHNYDLREVIARVGWEGVLAWGNEAYPSLVSNMFVSISNIHVDNNSCSVTISFIDRDDVITPERLGSIIGVPCTPNGITFLSDSSSEEERRRSAFDLCGFHSIWDAQKHHLLSFHYFPSTGSFTRSSHLMCILGRVLGQSSRHTWWAFFPKLWQELPFSFPL